MRNKFTDLMNNPEFQFNYTPIIPSIPEQDLVCREYNNIFSIPSDTHMSMLRDNTRVITGHIINTPNWEKFICSPFWGAVKFSTSGYNSLAHFLNTHNLCGHMDILNGDVVYVLNDCEDCEDCKCCDCPCTYCTTESQIPQPIRQLTIDNNDFHINECFRNSENKNEAAQKMNESPYIKGSSWVSYNNKIYGHFNNTTIIL